MCYTHAMKLDKQQSIPRTAQYAIAIIVVIIVGFLIVAALINKNPSDDKVEAQTGDYRTINPSEIVMEYSVTNTTDHIGKSSCSIRANDNTNTYTGGDFGYMSTKEIEPGETYHGNADIKISNNGARYITEGHISCVIEK